MFTKMTGIQPFADSEWSLFADSAMLSHSASARKGGRVSYLKRGM
jgi:hypothetical protein